ncbi:MAG: TldD/PmbA family protein [Anaerolineales bacterium]|nr:TldD/PmbA family protein [Anaerolineales bacterium]
MDYLQIAHTAVSQAQAAGAEADAYISVGSETSIQVSRGQVEKLSRAGSKGLGVRVIRDGRMGYAYTSDFSPDSVRRTVDGALALAEAADPDADRIIPEPRPIPDADLRIYDPALAELTTDDKVAFAKQVEAAALAADPRIRLCLQTAYIDGIADVYLANSRGFAGSYRSSFAAGYTMAMAMDGEERAMAMGLGVSTRVADLDAAAIGREAGERAAKLLGGKPVPTQRATVVYSPYAAAGLIGTLAKALTAEAMQKNRSFLHGKMGQDVAADRVTLLDNGRLPGGIATRPFDDEGSPTSATRLIDEGILQAVLYDSYTAHRDGTDSSGNATRGSHRQPPGLAPTNFYLQPGNLSPEALIAGVEKGLYVVNTMNTHSINPVSGDYSVSAQGFWIENGQLTHPVNEVTIALPLGELLKNVRAVADDLLFLPFGGAIGSPTFRVDGVMIGGAG